MQYFKTITFWFFPGLVYVTYYLDNNTTNPYLQWKNIGSPDFPTIEQFKQLRKAEVFQPGVSVKMATHMHTLVLFSRIHWS